MQIIELKSNPSGLKVYVNGKPDLHKTPEEALGIVIAALEPVLSEHYDQYIRRKVRDRPK